MKLLRNILVCVTQQKTCERLIHEAVRLKSEIEGEIFVIHVAKNEWKILDNNEEGEALEYLFGVSKSIGASLTVLKSDEIVDTIVDFIVENNIKCVVIGKTQEIHKENNFRAEMENKVYEVKIYEV